MDDHDRRPNPPRPDPPIFAPVIFDDGDGSERRRGGGGVYESDAGLLRILGLIILLGVVILALVLPFSPVSVVGGGGDGGGDGAVSGKAREDVPALPDGLVALSKVYDIKVPEGVSGPWEIEVPLTDTTDDARNLAYYSFDGTAWKRIAAVSLTKSGTSAAGIVSSPPGSIAVLRRVALARSLALIVEPGGVPDPDGLNGASVVAVVGLRPTEDGGTEGIEGAAESMAAVRAASGDRPVYIGVRSTDADVLRAVLATPDSLTRHVESIALAADAQQADGVQISYLGLSPAQRDAFSSLIGALGARLHSEAKGLVVVIPSSPPADTGAYDWVAIAKAADALWVRGPDDPSVYYSELESLLAGQAQQGIDLERVHLVIDRHSVERTGNTTAWMSQREALALASTIDRRVEGAVLVGKPVTLRAANLGLEPDGGALAWDPVAQAVTFHYASADGEHTVWVANRFSVGFRLDLAARLALGGVVIAQADDDEALPDVWDTVIGYAEEGEVALVTPFGPYLTPCWESSDGALEGAGSCWSAETTAGVVVWRAPDDPGVYDVRLVVSDGQVFVGQEMALNVDVAEATPTPTPEPTSTPTPEPTATPTPEPTATATAAPTETATPTPTPEPTATATATPTPVPTGPPGPAGND